MELTLKREAFATAIARCKGVTEKRNTVPILSHVLIEHRDSNVYLKATDLEIGVSTILPLVGEGSDGAITLPCHKLAEILKASDADEVEIKTGENDWIHLKAGRAKFKLMGLDPRSFAAMPTDGYGNKDGGKLTIDARVLAGMIDRTIFAVSPNEAHYNLSGVYLEAIDGKARMTATDGHRLAQVERKDTEGFELAKGVIIPRAALVEARKLLDGHDGLVTLEIAGSAAFMAVGDTTLSMRLVEGEFPDYRGVMPKSEAVTRIVSAQRGDLFPALKRVKLMSNERFNGVSLSLNGGDNLILSSLSPEVGEATDEVGIESIKSGDAIKIGCNTSYLLDVLGIIPDEGHAQINLIDEVSPMVVTTPGDKDYRYVVMPMRL